MGRMRKTPGTRMPVVVAATVAVAVASLWLAAPASAAATVTIPTGTFTDGQAIAVSGTGFPAHSLLPTGLQIIECSDPGGTAVNLPTDAASGCDGTTVNGLQINTDANGAFSATYSLILLNSGNSSITCDAAHFCVLWVGQDFNGAFLSGPHAFSRAFEINAPKATAAEVPTTIVLPIAAAGALGTVVFIRRRRGHASSPA